MVLPYWRRWLTQRSNGRTQYRDRRLHLESLESRFMPATHTWTGATSSLWSDPTNWNGGSPANDNGAQLVFPANAMHLATIDDLPFNPSVEIQSMTFMGSDNYTLSGNAVELVGGILLDSTATTGTDVIDLPIVLAATQTWTVTNASRTLQVGGIISGAFVGGSHPGLTKDGAGTLILTANNVYSGTTTVAAGSLLVNGSQPLSNVIVGGTAALAGSGTVGTITTSGVLSPGGPGPGILHSGNTVFNAGSSLVLEFTGTTAGKGFSALVVNGTVNLSGSPTLSLTLGSFVPTVGNTFAIISSTGPITGTFDGLPDNSTLTVGGKKFLINYPGATAPGGSGVVVTAGTENTQTYVTSSLNPSPSGQPITFTATVAPVVGLRTPTPTGIVTFLDGTSPLSTARLSPAGTASFTTSTVLTAGPHSITAVYSGDMNFTTSTSAPLVQTVNPALATTIRLTSSLNPSVFSQPITLAATVTAVAPATGTPSGTVAFMDGATTLGTGTLDSNGRATFQTSTLAVGTHLITATYNGSPSFAASTTTSAQAQTVLAAATTTALASALNPSVAGQLVAFTATVSAAGTATPGEGPPNSSVFPGGTVQFQIDGANFGSPVALSSGQASSGPISSLSVSNHTVTAVYSGDAGFFPSTGTLTQTVNRANTNTAITASANLSVAGVPITFTALVQAAPPGAGAPSGTVTFRDGTTTLGTANINNAGTATLALATGAGANHSVTIDYSGDANFNPSTSSTSPPQDFVTAIYEDVLLRPPDTVGLDFWVQQLETGATRAAVAMTFENSAESLALEVDNIYQTYLKRSADAAGRAFWVNALLNGESEANVIVAFVTSAEYTAMHPSDSDYVSGLYQDVLGRPADAAGLANWLQMMQFSFKSRAQVALSFLSSPEAYLDAVNYDYTHFLKRSPDAAGQQTALAALQNGTVTPTEMSVLFLASDEYFVKAIPT
jgi:autotransporter-associated beta strand protein